MDVTAAPGERASSSESGHRRRSLNWALALIAVFNLPVGLQAGLFPRSFFDDFPLGRGWIAATGGAYDEHLVRDVGILFLALVIVTGWAAWARQAEQAVAVAWLVQGSSHLGFHALHLSGLPGVDRAGLIVSLVAVPALAAIALWRSALRTPGMGRPGALG